MVPIIEMVDTLRVIKNVPVLKVGDYVRLKRTMFRGDLAQVDWVEVTQNQVCLRLLPRIDYVSWPKNFKLFTYKQLLKKRYNIF